ncbi:hypothetical protein N7470_007487 [Penicillium chermesinum]|nr:hypothetical protein N7470_007487 [Penicillium chermesinum]
MEQLTNVIPLPGYRGSDRSRGFFALADITARNILDRLLDTLTSFNQKRIEAASSAVFLCPDPSGKLAIELNSQLEAWYSALPDPIKPDLTGEEKGNQQQCQLRLRFWNIKQIIFRTLVIYWTSPDYSDYADPALEACRVCIHACREFINNAHHILSVRTPYTYSVIQRYVLFHKKVRLTRFAESFLLEPAASQALSLSPLHLKIKH